MPDGAVPGGQAERLLCILAAHHGRFLPTTVLTDLLWRDRQPAEPARNLAALVSRLRRSLGRDRVEGDPRAYRLVRDDTTVVDVSEALDLVATAERELTQGLRALAAMSAEVAEGLLTAGVPLTGEPDADWVDAVRASVAGALFRARTCRWTAALELGDLETAVDEASRALADNPLDEPAARALMTAHQRRGAHADALGAYEDLRRHLAADLGTDPSPSTQEVFLAVLRHGSEAPVAEPEPAPAAVSALGPGAVAHRPGVRARGALPGLVGGGPGPGRPGAGHRRGGDRQECAQPGAARRGPAQWRARRGNSSPVTSTGA